MKTPGSGLIAPVPLHVLQAVLPEGLELLAGTGEYHAIVDPEAGDMQWAEDLAMTISADHPGRFYAFGNHPDYVWLTEIEAAAVLSSDEGAIDAARLGLPFPLT